MCMKCLLRTRLVSGARREHWSGALHRSVDECAPLLYTYVFPRVTHAEQVGQGLQGHYRDILMTYWQNQIQHLETDTHDYKLHQLPLARIKKVMKADPEVKMISAEAPILFAKGCDIFITELTMRAWIHAEENKRRTLQRSDIASALAKSDMFDFLIDIVPREEAASHAKRSGGQGTGNTATSTQSSAAGTVPLPAQHNNISQQTHSAHQAQGQTHPLGHPDFSMPPNPLSPDSDYRPQQPIYTTQVTQDASSGYGQPTQGYMGDVYGYPSMNAQSVCHV